jgi:hypothetical protein
LMHHTNIQSLSTVLELQVQLWMVRLVCREQAVNAAYCGKHIKHTAHCVGKWVLVKYSTADV